MGRVTNWCGALMALLTASAASAETASAAAGAGAPASLVGLWRTDRGPSGGRATVRIAPCGERLCGDVVDVDVADRSRVGTRILRDLALFADGRGARGEVYWPRRDRWFDAGLALVGEDALLLEVCVLGALICPKQRWRRAGPDAGD